MNKIYIHDKKGRLLAELDSCFVPDVGEFIWLDDTLDNHKVVKVTSRCIDLDKDNKRFKITLVTE